MKQDGLYLRYSQELRGRGDLITGMLNLMENGGTLNSGRDKEGGYRKMTEVPKRLCSHSLWNFALLFRYRMCNSGQSRYLLRLPDKIYLNAH